MKLFLITDLRMLSYSVDSSDISEEVGQHALHPHVKIGQERDEFLKVSFFPDLTRLFKNVT